MNITTAQIAMMSRVIAAFLASGGLNAGTPSEIASIPVSAVQPFANARSTRKSVRGPVSGGTNAAAADSIGTAWPVITLNTPTTSRTPMLPRKK